MNDCDESTRIFFTKEASELLAELVLRNKELLVDNNRLRKADERRKAQAKWQDIVHHMNSVYPNFRPTVEQAKERWRHLKKSAKRKNAQLNQSRIVATLGGTLDSVPFTPVEERIAEELCNSAGFIEIRGGEAGFSTSSITQSQEEGAGIDLKQVFEPKSEQQHQEEVVEMVPDLDMRSREQELKIKLLEAQLENQEKLGSMMHNVNSMCERVMETCDHLKAHFPVKFVTRK